MEVGMMPNQSTAASSIDDYIAKFPLEIREVLEELRALISAAAPGMTERISYGMPTFDLNGHYLAYFAGWKNHIGFYPITTGIAQAFESELAPYVKGKGTARFPLGKPLPGDLIRRIVQFRVNEVNARSG
jgi:uncharacterized protein YdhG (YjbR/CyaY superfamily)